MRKRPVMPNGSAQRTRATGSQHSIGTLSPVSLRQNGSTVSQSIFVQVGPTSSAEPYFIKASVAFRAPAQFLGTDSAPRPEQEVFALAFDLNIIGATLGTESHEFGLRVQLALWAHKSRHNPSAPDRTTNKGTDKESLDKPSSRKTKHGIQKRQD